MIELKDAVEKNDVDIATYLIEQRGADVNAKSEDGQSLLYCALNSGNTEMVNLLIAKGADVNTEGEKGRRPLHSAAGRGDLTMAKLLIEKGADVNAQQSSGKGQGETPLHLAVYGGDIKIAELLISKGADLTKGHDAVTPLHVAAREGSTLMAELLIAKGADVNAKTINWWDTPLHFAAKGDNSKMIELLIAKGAKVNAKNRQVETPLEVARDYHQGGNHKVVKALAEAKTQFDRVTRAEQGGPRAGDLHKKTGHATAARSAHGPRKGIVKS